MKSALGENRDGDAIAGAREEAASLRYTAVAHGNEAERLSMMVDSMACREETALAELQARETAGTASLEEGRKGGRGKRLLPAVTLM